MPPTILDIDRMGPPRVAEVVYPESDGKPMADNTRQFRYIATLKGGFDAYYKHRDDVFVAGDLLWYPVEGDNKTRFAPDVLIAFGRPPGDRGSYLQWRENGQSPDVLFEVLSPGNTKKEMQAKFDAYERFGANEYYIYDPDNGTLEGWWRDEATGRLQAIEAMLPWKSPLCELRFHLEGHHLVVTRPDGHVFLTPTEADDAMEVERAQKEAALQREVAERAQKEAALQREAAERAQKEAAMQREAAERAEKEVAMKCAASEKGCAEKMAARLRELGIDPSDVS
jgi:Uma2 family endonuclease